MFMTTTDGGETFAFPNVCNTPSASGTITIPYPSTGGYDDADDDTVSTKVTVANKYVCTTDTEISSTSGDEAGTSGGVISGTPSGPPRRRSRSHRSATTRWRETATGTGAPRSRRRATGWGCA